MALTELLAFVLESRGGEAVVSDVQRVGQAGVQSQTQLQTAAARSDTALAGTARAGAAAGDAVEDGARRGTSRLQALGDRVGITGDLLRTGVAVGATVGFGVLVAKAGEAVNAYVDLAGEVRNFQRISGAGAEEASRYVAVFDDLQISSDKAGTALGRLARVDPSKLEQYGIAVERGADGNVSLTETLLNVADAYARTEDPQQRVLIGNAAFGRGFQELIPLLEQGRSGLQGYFEGVNEGQIYTQEALDQAREYELALDALQDAAADFGQSFGQTVVPALTDLLNTGAGVVQFVQNIPAPLTESALSAAALGVAGVAASRGLSRMAEQEGRLGTLAGRLGSFGRLGTAGAAIGAAIPLVTELTAALRSMVVDEPDVARLSTALSALGNTGSSSGALADIGGIEGFTTSLQDAIRTTALVETASGSMSAVARATQYFNEGAENIESMDEALTQLVSSGQTESAAAAFDQLADAAAAQGIPLELLKTQFPQYTAAVEDAAIAQVSAADSGSELADAAAEAADVISEAEYAVSALTDALDKQNGSARSLAEADIAVRDAMVDNVERVNELKEAGDAYATSLDRSIQTGRDNESALIDQIAAAEQFAEATARQTGSTQAGEEAFRTQIAAIRDNMLELGFNEQAVDRLIATYGQVPPTVRTQIFTDNASALANISAVARAAGDLQGRRYAIYVDAIATAPTQASRAVAVQAAFRVSEAAGRATGGAVEAGTDYVVGEVRPELFRPQGAGTVMPNTGAVSGPARSGATVQVMGDMVVRKESDVDRVAQKLARLARTGGGP